MDEIIIGAVVVFFSVLTFVGVARALMAGD
jgi:hypothetical protein